MKASGRNGKSGKHQRDDAYWGDGGDGTGQNMLGRVVMEVREELGEGAS